MTIYTIIFYFLAALIVVATGFAITRRNLVHAVVWLVLSFFGTAMLFYLLGAPLLAALEIIIYAGAIMILFLFIIMMLRVDAIREHLFPFSQWMPATVIGAVYLILGAFVVYNDPESPIEVKTAVAEPSAFGEYVFAHHWLSVEIVSLLLLIALVGALLIGRQTVKPKPEAD